MNTAIIYGTKHGSTHKCANTLANEMGINTRLFSLETENDINISEYDTIIIGGSIHAGLINKKVKKFIDKNINILSEKKIGLFLCCMYEGDKALEQFQNAFPEVLRNTAVAHGLFGGEFDFEKMNFLEKAIVKKVANVEKSVSNINYDNIKAFAKKMSP
ncbi:MAG: flavodoxin domain-containing protein [Bacteroidales bacterium]|nr:flavodoxin domain-containing protein [Bacteroidales bacterium]